MAAILSFSFVGIAKADAGPPSKQTAFYFQKNGQPFMQPVKFTVKCYGASAMDSASKLLKISEFSETCQTYGCKFDTSNAFEVYRQNTKYCDLAGEANGEEFAAKDFLGANMSGLSCHRADYTISTGDKYYKETPGYKDCLAAVQKEYYPDGENFICHKSLVEVPKNECGGYGYIIKNDICYKFTSETNTCIAEMDQKKNLCKQYLEDMTAKLAKDKNGYPFEEICGVKINIPASISNEQLPQKQNPEPTLPAEPPQSKNIFIRIIDFFRCSFLKLFGKSC